MIEEVDFLTWQKLDLRVGKILKAEDIEGADKLYKLEVDLGKEKRVVCAGIKQYYKKEELEGKRVIVFCNLEPRVMRGVKSEGMILAAVNEDSENQGFSESFKTKGFKDESKVILIQPKKEVSIGSKVEFKNG